MKTKLTVAAGILAVICTFPITSYALSLTWTFETPGIANGTSSNWNAAPATDPTDWFSSLSPSGAPTSSGLMDPYDTPSPANNSFNSLLPGSEQVAYVKTGYMYTTVNFLEGMDAIDLSGWFGWQLNKKYSPDFSVSFYVNGSPTATVFTGALLSSTYGGWEAFNFSFNPDEVINSLQIAIAQTDATNYADGNWSSPTGAPLPGISQLSIDNLTLTATAVPEPGTLLLLGSGLLGLGLMRRKQRRA